MEVSTVRVANIAKVHFITKNTYWFENNPPKCCVYVPMYSCVRLTTNTTRILPFWLKPLIWSN